MGHNGGMTPLVSEDTIARQSPEAQAIIGLLLAEIERLRVEVTRLQAEVAVLRSNPRNSSKPPSTEHPHAKPPANKPKSQRKRGGQPGHPKFERALIPVEECAAVHEHRPKECRGCGGKLSGVDPAPLRHQVWELPEIKPLVSEHRRHRLTCSCCGTVTCGELPPGVPQGQAGPRLIAFAALLMGSFRQSKRKTALFLESVLQIPCSPGWVVKLQNQATAALRPGYEELAERLPAEGRLNIDESPHKQGPLKTWLWAFVAATFTVFALRPTRKAEELYAHVGEEFPGVVGCDRAKMYVALPRIQWCWAHLIRDFQALIDSGDGQAKRLGHDLLREVNAMFDLWYRVRDGTLTRRVFQQRMRPLRRKVEALLLRGVFSGNRLFVGMCEELYRGRANLWTFVDVARVEPTNNGAERALRHAVIWRKLSFGTQSDSGNRFVETTLTAIETCRQQGRNAFDYLIEALHASFAGKPAPSLLLGA